MKDKVAMLNEHAGPSHFLQHPCWDGRVEEVAQEVLPWVNNLWYSEHKLSPAQNGPTAPLGGPTKPPWDISAIGDIARGVRLRPAIQSMISKISTAPVVRWMGHAI